MTDITDLNIDLNIDNYTYKELEDFLKITNIDDMYEIEQKINKAITKVNTNDNFHNSVKNKLINFINNAGLLVSNNRKIAVDNKNIIYKNMDNYINTYPNKNVISDLNQIKRQNLIKTLSFNTLFRDDLSESPSNCTFTLPLKINNIISVKLSSLEFPCSYYSISEYNKNNTFNIYESTTEINGTITVPDGNYTADQLTTILTDLINNTLSTSTRFDVTLDDYTGKITITNTTNNFTLDFNTNNVIYKCFGWFLGFRKKKYEDSISYTSEAVCNLNYSQYIYFSLNDYNIYNCDFVIAIFKDKFIDNNLIAKIPIKVDNFNVLLNDNSDFISKERRFFGPIDYSKISIKIYDQYGTIININNDFSFTIEVEIIYDL